MAAVLGCHTDFPAERSKFLFAENIRTAASADEDDALLRRMLREQEHRRHAVAAGDEQGSFAAGFRHGEAVTERRDDA